MLNSWRSIRFSYRFALKKAKNRKIVIKSSFLSMTIVNFFCQDFECDCEIQIFDYSDALGYRWTCQSTNYNHRRTDHTVRATYMQESIVDVRQEEEKDRFYRDKNWRCLHHNLIVILISSSIISALIVEFHFDFILSFSHDHLCIVSSNYSQIVLKITCQSFKCAIDADVIISKQITTWFETNVKLLSTIMIKFR